MKIHFRSFYVPIIIVVSFLQFSFASAETNSSKKPKGQIEPKQLSQNKNSTEHETGEVPDTILPVKKTIRNTITLKGFIEDPDAIPISIDTQSWADLRVSVPPKHGKEVKKGEIIMELDMDKTNLHGGAISFGHPLGASGSRITAHLANEFLRTDAGKVHVGSACIGGGQGIAVVLERV